jgi:hypothetical protein
MLIIKTLYVQLFINKLCFRLIFCLLYIYILKRIVFAVEFVRFLIFFISN